MTTFLMTFEISNMNVHNSLAYSSVFSNVIPYTLCKKLNAKPQKISTQNVQINWSNVKVMGELEDVLTRLASNLKVHQVIDIIFVGILKSYGVVLSKN